MLRCTRNYLPARELKLGKCDARVEMFFRSQRWSLREIGADADCWRGLLSISSVPTRCCLMAEARAGGGAFPSSRSSASRKYHLDSPTR